MSHNDRLSPEPARRELPRRPILMRRAELAAEYQLLVHDRLEERAKEVDRVVGRRAQELAMKICELDGTAADVTDLHLAAVNELARARNERRVRAVLHSGHLVLAEVLGHLANHYRLRALDASF